MAHQVALANEAVTAVLADLHRTTARRPTVEVDVVVDRVRIAIDGNSTTPSMWAVERAEALAEVGDYFQEELAQNLGCWPVCEEHDAGLYAEVHDGAAVWRCRLGDHSVARIGELGLTEHA